MAWGLSCEKQVQQQMRQNLINDSKGEMKMTDKGNKNRIIMAIMSMLTWSNPTQYYIALQNNVI